MMRLIAMAGMILATAAAAAADNVTVKSTPYKRVTVTDVKDGEIFFRISRRRTVRKPISDVTAITIAGLDKFHMAQSLLKKGLFADAIKGLDELVRRAPAGWRNRLMRHWRLRALGESGQAGRWVQDWLWLVNASSNRDILLGLRPKKVGPRGSKDNAQAILLLEAKLKIVRDKNWRTAIKTVLLDLYQREGRKEAEALAKELLSSSGATTTKAGNGKSDNGNKRPVLRPIRNVSGQFRSAAVLLRTDPGRALSVLKKNLNRYSPADLSTAMLLLGKAQQAMAARSAAADKQGLLLKAGLNFMRVWAYYPGGANAAEALYLAGNVNASMSPANPKAALAVWNRTITLYPKSPFAGKARIAKGKLKG